MHNVAFGPGGMLAYRPGQILIPQVSVDLVRRLGGYPVDESPEPFIDGWVQLVGVEDVLTAVGQLRNRGILAQPNHVLFANCGCGCGCGPHPADPRANPYYANPYYANPYYANPYYANPYYANPYYANPYYANPYYANPYYANPYYANAHAANPNPGLSQMSDSETPRSSARPAEAVDIPKMTGPDAIRVTVLDTGFALEKYEPAVFTINGNSDMVDVPDALEQQDDPTIPPFDGDDKFLDPAAGHGTFIAGVIRQNSKYCDVTVLRVLSTYGVGDEVEISQRLAHIGTEEILPQFVNLSFGGYSPLGMRPLAEAIEALVAKNVVVVASAGNDATCLPMYPASLPGVIGVAALDEEDKPAEFTNFGPWVRACTLGVNVVSTFFTGFNGAEPAEDGEDPDKFDGWAVWSGTSFAAPRVVAALANEMAAKKHVDPFDAVKSLIDDPDKIRMPMMGTIVKPSDDTSWDAVTVATKHTGS